MKRNVQKKWFGVGAAWLAVLMVTGWNVHLIDHIQVKRQDLETLRLDLFYLQANQSGIQAILRQKSRFIHPVTSASMGIVVLESDLKRFAKRHGLQQMRIDTDKHAADGRSMPVAVAAVGALPDIAAWLAQVEDAAPYLVIDRMEIARDPRQRNARLQATFTYRYTAAQRAVRS